MLATDRTAPVLRQSLTLANSLKWLLPEIDASLQRVRLQIDRQETDEIELDATTILSELKLIAGALSMAGCHGGAVLAEELLAAVELAANGPPLAEPLAALAAVSGATLQLSDYLDGLCQGSSDCAAVLQPAIGELRLACQRPAITEADLFVVQMQRLAPRLPVLPEAERLAAASVVAGKLLAPFQALLLQWLKGVDVANTLLKLRKIGDHIASNAAHPEIVLLWAALAAAMDSLIAEPTIESLELKRWVGRLAPHLKILAERGEDAAASPAANEIAWRLLAHAAPIHQDSSRWQTLRQQLPLDGLLPIDAVMAEARQRLRGPNTRLLEKVGEEVRADLTLVKDGLDLALRAGGLAPATQASTRERLIRIASTLSLLGLPQLEQVLRNQANALSALGDQPSNATETWMRIATALLRVEHSLEAALFRPLRRVRDPLREPANELNETTPHSQDLRESVAALLREMLVDLARLKSQLDAYLKGGTLRDVFEPEQLLTEVASGLVMLDNPAATVLCTHLRDWLGTRTPSALRDDPALAVRFAEAVAALEIYLEALRDALPQPGRVLETLSAAISALMLSAPLVRATPSAPPQPNDQLLQELAAIESGIEGLLPAESRLLEAPAPLLAPPAPTVPVAPAAAVVPPLVAVTLIAPPVAAPAAGDDDPEIRGIFIEEAQEVLDTLKRLLPGFRRDPDDRAALGDIRRAFHTLKGSGRMVGATRIGEFGWSLEHLLNRCIEGALPVNPPVVALLDDALTQLPRLLEEFQHHASGSPDDAAQALIARAHFLASGRAPEMVETEVLNVFRTDALDRLTDVERWLSDPSQIGIDPDATRALHTLKGSAAVVNAEALSQLAGAFERVLKHLAAADVSAPPEVRAVLSEALPVLRRWTEQAGQGDTPPDSSDWLARVEALKPFLPPPGETKNFARRDTLVNLAYDRLQIVEQRLVAWTSAPGDAALGRAMADAAEALTIVAEECAPLARCAEALTQRLRQDDVAQHTPGPAFLLALANALEHCYQYLDVYREGGVRESGRELAAQLMALPLVTEPVPEPRPEPSAEAVPSEPALPEPAEPQELELVPAPPATALPPALPALPEQPDPELAALFVEEARELLATLHADTPGWSPAFAPPPSLLHALHTLTGSARMVGYLGFGDLCQGFERRLLTLATGTASAELLHAELLAALPVFDAAIDALAQGLPMSLAAEEDVAPPQPPALAPVQALTEEPASVAGDALDALMPVTDALPSALLSDGVADEGEVAAQADAPLAVEPLELLTAAPAVVQGSELLAPAQPRRFQAPATAPDEAIDPELASIFIAEAAEMLEAMSAALAAWRQDGQDAHAVGELQRALHTLKGGARMTGFLQMGDVTHEMESRVAALVASGRSPDASEHAALQAELEVLERQHDALSRGHYAEALRVSAPQSEIITSDEAEGGVDYEIRRPEPLREAPAPARPEGWAEALFWRPEEDAATAAARRELARVPVETLDTLLNEAGEISIYRSRLEQQNAVLTSQLTEMRQTIVRLREQLRLMDIETDAQIAARGLSAQSPNDTPDRYAQDFDPLEMDRYSRMQELSRALAETVGDLGSLHLTMDQGVAEAQALLVQQGRINTGVQQGLMGTLMVPFSRQVARLQRVVRQTAQEEGKFADASFEGMESEMDRNVLERMTAPLEHLLRNAVVHGLEDPAGRSAAGKPAMGTVTVALKREGTQLLMDVSDDGRGLNLDAIRSKATQRGLLPEGAVLGDDEIARFIFEPGFSTAETITQSAGRGVGMDVVASEVKQLGGAIELRSVAGQGTRFTVRLPLSLALSQALMVKVGDETYALPLVNIEGIGRVPREMAVAATGGGEVSYGYAGFQYRVRHLAELIDLPHALADDQRTVPAVLVRLGEGVAGGERRAALLVDQLIGNREVVSKAVGPQLSSISGVVGATILPSGEVVLILDPVALVIERSRRRLLAEAAASVSRIEPSNTPSGRLIMVVDDSVTMRRVAERLLLRQGYRVLTAKDGLDAIALLQNEFPAAILLDIEMPRADGFEVAGFVRNNERIRDTPIIMITSRSGDKHRTRAATLGVDRYLIKPYQEDQLLEELRALLQSREAELA